MASIEEAAAATNSILEHVSSALERLQGGFNGRIVNGFGIYADPSNRHYDLIEARKAIDAALAVMKATKWPTEAEYDAHENA
ncbi:hypothetical protein FY133_24205 (plasmid) [Agrobacterium tumefaciens]|uniref:Uncharacterized protein n=1 Tax=Agrobacterium tumefaciens TaxID=358 RepID=A0AAP9EAA8_AGRTU|nr:hypothetical protein [Agrobacterium tumefaciens]NSZ61137.1 hypothetical protein [Agrobacterium tumefaciens]QDY97551.1 hypothetical protein CG010_025615 [Agrobacterium tumefaciens]UXS12680.1 hypothetical protein FY155_23760 [Agrobacterium tumefaciens]UXS20041.1 hypothetical protein FY154_23750 [Agrobacterium tumefaciens]UXS27688.1 hypothetical protein FY153_24595 [Agrobacterium tumefaciens]